MNKSNEWSQKTSKFVNHLHRSDNSCNDDITKGDVHVYKGTELGPERILVEHHTLHCSRRN